MKFCHLLDPAFAKSADLPVMEPSNEILPTLILGDIDAAGDVPATCSPARAANLAGLPPTLIAVVALDLFVDEDIDYAARLGRAGVPIELHVYPGAAHAFDLSTKDAPASLQAKEDDDRALRKVLGAKLANQSNDPG